MALSKEGAPLAYQMLAMTEFTHPANYENYFDEAGTSSNEEEEGV